MNNSERILRPFLRIRGAVWFIGATCWLLGGGNSGIAAATPATRNLESAEVAVGLMMQVVEGRSDGGSELGSQNVGTDRLDEDIDPGFCPIRPEEPASVEISVDFQGRTFYFCCESCRQDFLSDPARFASLAIEQESKAAADELADSYRGDRGNDFEQSFWGRVASFWIGARDGMSWLVERCHLSDPINAFLVFCSSAIAFRWWFQWRGRRRAKDTEAARSASQNENASGASPWLVRAMVIMLLGGGFYAASLRRHWLAAAEQLRETEQTRDEVQASYQQMLDRDAIHYATFMNFGFPPRPLPSTQPKSLRKTYYRGNDERGPELFNGGNYRTVTFDLSLVNAEGRPYGPGDRIRNDDGTWLPVSLFVRFKRSPDTSSGYFTAEYMKRMYLTQAVGEFLGVSEPVADRVDWKMTEPNQVWEASFPLDLDLPMPVIQDASAKGYQPTQKGAPADAEGLVYLCEERYETSRLLGGRYHYAVQFRLDLDEGRILENSDLWMGAMYRGRNFGDLQIEPQQWLSDAPLPEKGFENSASGEGESSDSPEPPAIGAGSNAE